MKKTTVNLIISIVVICLFGGSIGLIWILGLAGLDSKPDEETGEIRQLAKFPGEFTNSWFADVNTYMNDHAPMRNATIGIMNGMDRALANAYEDLILNPIYDAAAEDTATPEPDASSEPTPTPDFGDLFGDDPTEEPTEEPTPEPTPEPTEEPFTGEPATCVASTLDSIILNNEIVNFGLGDGSAASKLDSVDRIVDNTLGQYYVINLKGWTGFDKEIESYGYKIGKQKPVFDQEFFTPHEDAVGAAGGEFARRFNIMIPIDELEGELSIVVAIRFVTGQVILMDGSFEHCDNMQFTLNSVRQVDEPVVFDPEDIEITNDKDVELIATANTSVELSGEIVSNIESGKGKNRSVVFIMKDGTVSFDPATFSAVSKAVKPSSNMVLSINELLTENLSDAQKKAVQEFVVGSVISVECTAGDGALKDFGGGKVTLALKYLKPSEIDGSSIKVASLSGDGTLEEIKAVYSNETITFTVTGFSTYVIYTDSSIGDTKPVGEPHTHEYAVIRIQEASFAHDGYVLERCSKCGNAKVTNIVLRTSLPGFYSGKKAIRYSGSGFKGLHDWYFYTGNDSIAYFQGDNVLTEEEAKDWADTYEELYRLCEKKGINVVYLLPPNKEQVYGEYMPSGVTVVEDSAKRQPQFVEYLKKTKSPIKYIYPLSQLKSAKILYETYLQQDTHWNSIGGFIGAMQVYSAIGMPTTGIQNVEVGIGETAGGDLVSLGVGPATAYASYSVNYKPEINVRQTYMFSNNVVGGNEYPNGELRIYESDANTSRKALIIGDSFRHAIAPYIAKDYSKVTMAHRGDFYTVSSFEQGEDGEVKESGRMVIQEALRELEAGDLLLIMAVERLDWDNVNATRMVIDFMAG